MQFFGEEEVMGVGKSSERFLGLVRSQRERAEVIREALTLVFTTSREGRVEERSGFRVRAKLSVHLGVLVELGWWERMSARGSTLVDMGVDRVPVSRCRRCGVVGDGMEIDNGVPGNHISELRCEVFRRSSLEVLGFLVKLEIVRWVIGWWWLECGW